MTENKAATWLASSIIHTRSLGAVVTNEEGRGVKESTAVTKLNICLFFFISFAGAVRRITRPPQRRTRTSKEQCVYPKSQTHVPMHTKTYHDLFAFFLLPFHVYRTMFSKCHVCLFLFIEMQLLLQACFQERCSGV